MKRKYPELGHTLPGRDISRGHYINVRERLRPNDSVLEIGFAGRDLRWYFDHGVKEVHGIELHDSMVKQQKSPVKAKRLDVARQALGYGDGRFDKVVAISMLRPQERGKSDMLRILRKFYKVAKPGGEIIFDVSPTAPLSKGLFKREPGEYERVLKRWEGAFFPEPHKDLEKQLDEVRRELKKIAPGSNCVIRRVDPPTEDDNGWYTVIWQKP